MEHKLEIWWGWQPQGGWLLQMGDEESLVEKVPYESAWVQWRRWPRRTLKKEYLGRGGNQHKSLSLRKEESGLRNTLFWLREVTSSITLESFVSSCCNRGHGTYMGEEKLIASVAGSVERVNKLICVKALKTRWEQKVCILWHLSCIARSYWPWHTPYSQPCLPYRSVGLGFREHDCRKGIDDYR